MKNLLLITSFLLGLCTTSVASTLPKELPAGYYMVVAAYAPSAEKYAINLVKQLAEKGIEANYGFSTSKSLYFVYSAKYSTREAAISSISSEREKTGESKAWVYVYTSENSNEPVDVVKPIEPSTEKVKETKKEKEEEKIIVDESDNVTKDDTAIIDEGSSGQLKEDSTSIKIEEVAPKEEVVETPISHQGKTYLYLEAFDAKTGKPISIDFEVIDLSRKKTVAKTHSNYSFALEEPTSASKMIQVKSIDIGWQPQAFDFKYYEPIIDSMSIFLDNMGDTTFVSFEMKHLKKGEVVTLYKVFFFKDASIMMKKSEYELDQVVSLLENNPAVKITIHGHTNGKSAGKIIALKEDSDVDFFNINGDHRELSGSAVALSLERARIVGRYLVSQGIDDSRFELKGWGGKKMIYDKHSRDAKYNVRVEIEVVEE